MMLLPLRLALLFRVLHDWRCQGSGDAEIRYLNVTP